MRNDDDASRREFLGQLGAGAFLCAAGMPAKLRPSASERRPAARAESGWTPPPVLKNPNILVIMVDQMRFPTWMNASQSAAFSQTVMPNAMGRILNTSYDFQQFFVNATVCTPSRACFMTGLYAPQTAVYLSFRSSVPSLNAAFPTWGQALPLLNPAYRGNLWWFGKWHLSESANSTPLAQYGFLTRTYPGGLGPHYNVSPNGEPNEGTNGGPFGNTVWASDALIAGDFVGWIQGQAPTPGPPSSPWCATVSFVNPHDITVAPVWLEQGQFPPPGAPLNTPAYFPPPSGSPPSFYTTQPSPWNWENLSQLPNKPALQLAYQNATNRNLGTVTDWVLFLNQYYWLQNFVDQQIGLVLDALYSSPFASNTIVIFTSDHGEYAGSHGLHTKGFAVYDESLRVPFCIQYPGQNASVTVSQMSSAVDFFGLMCDLATGGSGVWRLAYPDLAGRQSMWNFLYNNSSETRVMPGSGGLPYILHTFDDVAPSPKSHIVCLRTKNDPNAGAVGAKLAFYWAWNQCTTYPNSTSPDAEFYDYNPATSNNTSELGNDFNSNSATTQATIEQYTQALGTWASPSSGLIANELNAPLVGTGTGGNPLSQTQAAAQQAYFNCVNGTNICSS